MKPALSERALDEPLADELTEQALQWLVDLHAGEGQSANWDDYLRWCEASEEHRRAARAAERLWERLGSTVDRPKARRMPLLGLLLAIGLAGGAYWQAQSHGWMADERTAVGERRSLLLADGSQLELAPRTRVDIEITDTQRLVRLYAGEVFVQVAADPQRPFEIEAGNGRMRALGTAFDVRSSGDTVKLVVTEHTVRVTHGDASQVAEVEEGQGLQYGAQWLSRPQAMDVSAAIAWRRDRLVFNERPLGEVVDELRRYHTGAIWLRGDELNSLPVTGIVGTGDVAAQLQLLQQSLPLRVRQLPWLTVIERDPVRTK
ncbi:FecR domain-containing protein [Pseudomonas sp. PDM16]|uniref:FecR family protein n=1 Tax=Pseudomonas sp. PDM16 TaxID=2769292 RepID=UPI00177D5032|nr:FecR domain-containing protein [Pseudomonas sp. PDM16]MBD9413688.1 FecR domain-containing protein [Pseudomonas sp. PDM16]